MIQILDLYHDGEYKDIFCPICGQKAGTNEDYCPHQTFVYSTECAPEFVYCSDAFEPVVKQIEKTIEDLEVLAEQDDDFDDDQLSIQTQLESLPKSSSAFIFRVTTSGYACGPMTDVCYYGFDADQGEEDSDEDVDEESEDD